MRTGRPEDGLLVSPYAQPPWLAARSRTATVLHMYIWFLRPVLDNVFELFFRIAFSWPNKAIFDELNCLKACPFDT